MIEAKVGAGILNVITESLYDKPIVVFREYVQNSVDSFFKVNDNKEELCSQICFDGESLFFLDNGVGIEKDEFLGKMKDIGGSGKNKTVNIGYKGIGRLSGIPYCKEMVFVNICSYRKREYQEYRIDGRKYNDIKKDENYKSLSFNSLMDSIGSLIEAPNKQEREKIQRVLDNYSQMFENRDTGFLVILEGVNAILKATIEPNDNMFFDRLGWLLPVDFQEDLLKDETRGILFKEFASGEEGSSVIPAKGFNIYYNNKLIERPIHPAMLRDYICKISFEKYATGFESFYRNRIAVENANAFSGIRIYIDNILLCDEKELLPILQQYGLIEHTANELIQSVKGMGVIIYITDKVNISANARRTFIEVTDNDSLEFLRLLAAFIEKIYSARYALSKYSSGKKTFDISQEKLDELRKAANEALKNLAQEEITIQDDGEKCDFENLSETDQKKAIKAQITKEINRNIKSYLNQATAFSYKDAYKDFKTWLLSN